MKSKSWFLVVSISLLALLLVVGGITYLVDPYFHYRAPMQGLSYKVEKASYINDGISRNFDYNAMITGPSMTSGFKTAEADALFEKDFVRITYLGEGFYRTGKNVRRALESNDKLDLIIWSIDPIWYVTDVEWEGYDTYPDYMLNDNVWDDVNYLLNGQVFVKDTIPEIVRTMEGIPAEDLDMCAHTEAGNKEVVLSRYQRSEKQNKQVTEEETEALQEALQRNIEGNIISVVKENPDVTFYFFIPPLSILWWDDLNQISKVTLLRRIDLEQRVIDMLLPYENVKLFSFEDDTDIVCNLDLYSDTIHYSEEVNSYMLNEMQKGDHLLTEENYKQYLEYIRSFYGNYDYDQLFSEDGHS